MNTNEMKQRLIEASLTDTIPETPIFDFPGLHRRYRLSPWMGYAAAACIALAIVLPISIHRSTHAEWTETVTVSTTIVNTESELEGAFAMISQHFSASENNLIDMVQ